jgi:hypothetical protein
MKFNQVRPTSSTPSLSFQYLKLLISCVNDLVEMCFAHLKPLDVRFMSRFAQHDSHHVASYFMSIGLFVHHIYHMFVSFLGVSEAPSLLA